MFALHKAFEQSTKSVEDAVRAERERRSQLAQTRVALGHPGSSSPSPSQRTGAATALGHSSQTANSLLREPATMQRSSSYQSRPRKSPTPPLVPSKHLSNSRSTDALQSLGPAPTGELLSIPSPPSSSPLNLPSSSVVISGDHGRELDDGSGSHASGAARHIPDLKSPSHQVPILLRQPRGVSTSDGVVREDIFATRPDGGPSSTNQRQSSPFRQHHELKPPLLDIPQGTQSSKPGSPSQLLETGGPSSNARLPGPPSPRSISPAEPRTSFSGSTAAKFLGRMKRDKSSGVDLMTSDSDSGAGRSSAELSKAQDGQHAKARPSHETHRGRLSFLSGSPTTQGFLGSTIATAPQQVGSRRPSTSIGIPESQADGRRSPSVTTGSASLRVPKSSTDSSIRRFSFGFLASAIHTGRSNETDSTDSAALPQVPASSTSALDIQDEPRWSGVSSRSATSGSGREEGRRSTPRSKEKSTTAGNATSSTASFVKGEAKANVTLLSDQSKFNLFPKINAVSSAPQDRAAASPGKTNSHSVHYFDESNGQSKGVITTSPNEHMPTTERSQLSTRPSASNILRSIRSRSSNNLRLFGRSATSQSGSVPQAIEGADVNSLRNDRGNSGGSRLAVPSMVQAFALSPPIETAPRPASLSPSAAQTSSTMMARAFSKRRPATGTDDTSLARYGGSGEAGDVSPVMSRSSLAVDDRRSVISKDGRLRRTSGTNSVISAGAGRPINPGGPPADQSKLGAAGGAATLFGSGSEGRSRTLGKSGKSIFSGGGSGGSNWLTPRKKNPSDLDLVNATSSNMDRKPSDLGASNALKARLGDPVQQQQSLGTSPAPPDEPKPVKCPPLSDESPQAFCDRIEKMISPGDVVTVLANSGDSFFVTALRCHMRRFLFVGNPLDIALRKLLMEVCLPKETQQIDRVMEAFAQRYNECNEGLFASEDQPYILAFSLMMLHTDAFNKNAKNKMTKADYVRNSSSSGVAQDVLEYLYDNLTFTEFVYFDGSEKESHEAQNGLVLGASAKGTAGASSVKEKNGKIDVYLLIKQGRLSEFQPWIEHLIPEDDPYSWSGTEDDLDVAALAEAYLAAPSIEISTNRRPSLISSSSGVAATLEFAGGAADEPSVTLRVFKVGIILRKDDVTEKGKRGSRKWRPCGVILSSSQLLFFRDLVWIDALKAQIAEQVAAADPVERQMGIIIAPRIRDLKPDDVISLNDALAVRDDTYEKHENVLRLLSQQGNNQFEYLFQAKNEDEMNDWCAAINFCACFRAAGLKVTNLDAAAFTKCQGAIDQRNQSDVSGPLTPSVSPQGKRLSDNELVIDTSRSDTLLPHISARKQQMLPRLQDFTNTLASYSSELAELLRLAKHFAIMTPFQRTTKERIEAAAVPLAARIKQLRITVAKYESRTFILASELRAAEEEEKKMTNKNNGSSFDNWKFTPGSNDGLTGFTSSPPFNRTASDAIPGSLGSGLENSSKPTPGDRKGSSLSQTGRSDERSSPVSPTPDPRTEGGAVYGGEPRTSRPQSSPKASMDLPTSPRRSIGSFAPASHESDYASSIASTTSRTRLSTSRRKVSSASGALLRRELSDARGDTAESWEATRAFRDPDKICIAQLPDLNTLEAAARMKGLQRAAIESTPPLAVDDLDASIALPSARSGGKIRKESQGSIAEVERLTKSSSISSGSHSYPTQ